MHFHPSDFDIFRSLERHFHLVRRGLETLRLSTEGSIEPAAAFSQIQKLERDGAEILRSAIRQLDRQMIDFPPREDSRRFFHHKARILDAAGHLAGRLAAYRLGALPDPALRLAMILESCGDVLAEALRAYGEALRFGNEIEKMADLVNEADQLCIAAIRELTDQERDVRRLFMLHEVYGMFWKIANLFEDCIQVLEDSALKAPVGT